MLTDRPPEIGDSDDYIRDWAWVRGGSRLPKMHVHLINANKDGPDAAEIDFSELGFPVRRYKRASFNGGSGQ